MYGELPDGADSVSSPGSSRSVILMTVMPLITISSRSWITAGTHPHREAWERSHTGCPLSMVVGLLCYAAWTDQSMHVIGATSHDLIVLVL